MNLQEIIESGLIELYAMNALSEAEAAQVEAWAKVFPEVRTEIEEAQAALELYAQAHAVEPSSGMKAKIMANFEADLGGKSRGKIEKNTENLVENPEKRPLSITREKTDLGINFGQKLPWAIAALALIAAIAGFWKASNTQKQLSNCQTESAQLVQKQQVIVDLEQKMNILRDTNTKSIDLRNVPNPLLPKGLLVKVYWNAKDKATLLSILNLPKPLQGKQYQLWAIEGKNAPVDAGVITYDMTAMQPMKIFEKVDMFAITLENEGGSVVPTLEQMYVAGTTL
jgi:anti-sigma-K factor RskA